MHLPIAIRAKRASSRTVDGLSRLGDQFTFHARVITSIPATLKRYWREVARLVAQVAFGSGTLLAGGGS
ncbi:MAG: ABC transporter permease, partial [Rhodococcus sp. (in: high G+C Gram-positive bacteria)]|nr:ABC transporter permease [Rhodococcus sp. (in: high G+C Gram-positive bacteria)]